MILEHTLDFYSYIYMCLVCAILISAGGDFWTCAFGVAAQGCHGNFVNMAQRHVIHDQDQRERRFLIWTRNK